jgi:hypothetical protein
MDSFSKRAGFAAGGIIGAVLAFFLVKFILFAEGFLAALLIGIGLVAAGSVCAARHFRQAGETGQPGH